MIAAPLPREAPVPQLIVFISTWVPDLEPRHRMDPQAIPPFVPSPLRQIYELAGNYPVPSTEQWRRPTWIPGLFGAQDQLLPPDQLQLSEGRFAFVRENQDAWHCETLADEKDPPVFSTAPQALGSVEAGMPQVCPTLSHFLTTFCLQELAFGSHHVYCVESPDVHPEEVVTSRLSPLWLDGSYAWGSPTHQFYTSEHGLLVVDMRSEYLEGGLWIAFNDDRCGADLSDGPQMTRLH